MLEDKNRITIFIFMADRAGKLPKLDQSLWLGMSDVIAKRIQIIEQPTDVWYKDEGGKTAHQLPKLDFLIWFSKLLLRLVRSKLLVKISYVFSDFSALSWLLQREWGIPWNSPGTSLISDYTDHYCSDWNRIADEKGRFDESWFVVQVPDHTGIFLCFFG